MVDLMVDKQQSGAAGKGVPAGFKLTEVGIIPEDWDVSTILNLTTNIIDYRGRTPKKLGMDWGGDIVALSAGNVKKGYIDLSSECYFGSKELYKRWMTSGHPQKGDIAFTMEAPLGNAASIPDNNRYILSQRTILLQIDEDNFSPPLILQALLSDRFQLYISESATGSTAQGIKRSIFEKLCIALPKNIVEQKAIANALANIDNLINSLERLLTKKQSIKTATMQQLLTGKTRLPQFALRKDGTVKGYRRSEFGDIPEDWETSTLDNFISKLDAGVSVNSVNEKDIFSHGKNILKTSCVSNGYFYGHEAKSIVPDDINRAKTTPKKGCIIISRMNTPNLVGELGYVERDEPNLYLPDRLWQMNVCQEQIIDNRWLAYILSFPLISNKLKETATGTSNSMKNISKDSLYSLSFPRPSKDEQTAIATILSDMDKEIQTLQQRLDKTRQLKQGMMQELLTGKTRLI
ncbi:restriction endonuclease subunit S [Edwardsiella ictaluri]|uniref:restriction endonuclease subunit S n=1 Tax=Edwardsiella ictaluri TaxID=67780 RepID=UPI00359473FA